MNHPVDPDLRALEETIREMGESLRRLALWCELIAARLGHELSDTPVVERPGRLVNYRVQGLSAN